MGERRVVIITGMHRSGTSLTASLLQHAGVDVGSWLLPPNEANPRGYFEDVDFYGFHENALRNLGQTWLVQDPDLSVKIDPKDVQRATELIDARRKLQLWGWKDPRTCLFLDFWHGLLPEARFVFVYRHPLEVTLSVLRRAKRVDVEALTRPLAVFRSWHVHNDRLLHFYQRHPDVCFLAHVHAIAADPEGFVQSVSAKLGLSLRPDSTRDVYAEDELRQTVFPNDVLKELGTLLPNTMSLLAKLESSADLSGFQAPELFPKRVESGNSFHTVPDNSSRDEDELARDVSLLLLRLAPETFLASRESLDDIRLGNLSELRSRLEARVQAREHEIQSIQAYAKEIQQRLSAIESSRAWRAAQKWYRFKRTLSDARDWVRIRRIVTESDVRTRPSRCHGGASTRNDTVLFISHDARPHDAQLLLLHFLRWLANHTNIRFEILLQEGGPLKAQFEALAPVSLWHEQFASGPAPPKESHRVASALELLRRAQIGLIYCNTLSNGDILYLLSKAGLPILCHTHELSYFMTYDMDPFLRRNMRHNVDHFIAASQAVKESLVQTMAVPSERISVVHEFIPPRKPCDTSPEELKRRLSISKDARIVGGVGSTDWSKGPDLFIQLARAVQKRRLPEAVHFIWIGGANEGPTFGALWHDVVHTGVEDRVHFLGHRENVGSYVNAFDVFASTSREDPLSLVCLEAAARSKPIVCFEGSGGTREFVEEDCGFVVTYLDIEAMANRVVDLLKSTDLRSRLGNRARDKVHERHDVSVAAPKLVEIIENLLGRDPEPTEQNKQDFAR